MLNFCIAILKRFIILKRSFFKIFYGVSFINLEFYIRYMFLHVKTFCSIIRKSLYFMFLRVWFIYDFLFFLFYTLSHDFETMNEFYISIFKF